MPRKKKTEQKLYVSKVELLPLQQNIWKVTASNTTAETFFYNIDDVVKSVNVTCSKTAKPIIETSRFDYVSWRLSDGSLIEARQVYIYNEPTHL